ncbi:MAG: hypothetical protein P0S94_02770, partial [Simkaniaceae bacterium]|nr:hypothetical protein [Simkaniaceae bacterium]
MFGAGDVQRVAQSDARPGYTINFNNVSIIEFLKFISKIGDVNFVYNEEELGFNVTVVSEEETSLTNVMSALVQVLRINGFSLIDDGANLLIHKSPGVNQIATVVSAEMPYEGAKPPPIVTRLFRIQNGNPAQIAKIVKPLMSSDVILEVSNETRHLVITDVVANVDRVADLLLTLDAAKSPLDLDVYHVKNTTTDKIVPLAEQILTPLSEGNPLIIVPQTDTQAIYILSTPFLVEKAMSILEDLDETPSMAAQSLSGNNVLIYKLQYQSPQAIEEGINQIGENLTTKGGATSQLVMAAKSMRYVQATNSLIFTGDPSALAEIKTILTSLDTPTSQGLGNTGATFFIYKIKQANEEQISKSLNNLAENLEDSKYPDETLIAAIDSMKWVKETNSLIFTGSPGAITRLKEIVPTFDVEPGESRAGLNQIPASTDFYIYTPQVRDGKRLLGTIDQIADNLRSSGLTDPAFLRALESAKWNPSTGSILFTGDTASLQRVKELVSTLDTEEEGNPSKVQIFIYKPNYVPAKALQRAL